MHKQRLGYLAGASGVLVCVLALFPFRNHLNSTPVALALLLVVLFTAAAYGSIPAVAISVLSVLCFNYFFLPPYSTFTIAEPQNWIALGAFLITALIAGSLSARVKRRAEEAEQRQKEIQELYVQLQEMFNKASQAEAMKQSEQLKSALLDAVTHDLRTPLTSMKAAVTTLAGSTDPQATFTLDEEGRREMLEVINTEIDRLNHHLEGLIEIAKIEAGAMQPRRSWTNLEEIVSISLTRASGIIAHHHVQTDLEENLPPVRVDEKSITEVIYLLLENATKYAPEGSQILVEAKTTSENADQGERGRPGSGCSSGFARESLRQIFPRELGKRFSIAAIRTWNGIGHRARADRSTRRQDMDRKHVNRARDARFLYNSLKGMMDYEYNSRPGR